MRQLMIVRRGQHDRFLSLQQTFGPDPIRVEIIWDRRNGDRRERSPSMSSTAERRRHERRGPVPSTWGALDFIVVSPRDVPGQGHQPAAASSLPCHGDVLIRRELSRNGPCTVNHVPDGAVSLFASYEAALRRADALAAREGVDAWYTEDDERFAPVRRYRGRSSSSA